ncbi:hypothetical protein FH063_004262 [Azospirillum argentinense]|uniref:Uncharacterized protein n=1 Tax=Azospirillum argentinense TaxID=2970906 RepID=A0A5B0KKM5_9PROT|nr:hypothetical protein FH063_004262 [Azospirillum argentinense]
MPEKAGLPGDAPAYHSRPDTSDALWAREVSGRLLRFAPVAPFDATGKRGHRARDMAPAPPRAAVDQQIRHQHLQPVGAGQPRVPVGQFAGGAAVFILVRPPPKPPIPRHCYAPSSASTTS